MPAVDIPSISLAAYLPKAVPGFGELREVRTLSGGQSNPTYLLRADSGDYVLRRKPYGELLKSAHAVEREFRAMSALRKSDVPVPDMVHLCEDVTVIGTVFFVMSFVRGRQFWDPALPELNPEDRGAVYDEMNRVLAALHAVDFAAAGLADFGKPGNYFERQTATWTRQYRASQTGDIAAMETLIEWLPANAPPDDGRSSLIHGDYRLDNILFSESSWRTAAVLDWELSTLGHPFADLAYQCMQLRMPRESVIKGLGGADRAALGIPTEAEYVSSYCRRAGLDGIPRWNFYLVFSFFRLAAILQGVMKRAIDGNAASRLALEYGAGTAPLAEMAVELLDA